MLSNHFPMKDRTGVFLAPTRTVLGRDSLQGIADEVSMLGSKTALIVTDPGVMATGLAAAVSDLLKKADLGAVIYDRVIPEPPARLIDEAGIVARDHRCDAIIGLGGGSSLDVAKGVAMMATHDGHILDYVGVNAFRKRGLPLILVPTTAGTGSEASWVCVVTDETENTKKSLYSSLLLPAVAVLDPVVTRSMPPSVTADTGFDALVHAVDSYISLNATPYTRVLSLQAIALISHNLPRAYAKGADLEARYNMLFAANLAGMAFTSGGLGATHGLAYALGTEFHMSHGRSNAVMLPYVMRFNARGDLQAYAEIAAAMGEITGGLDMYEAADKAVDAVEKLLAAVNIPCRLSAYGIETENVPALVREGLKQARFYVNNPRDVGEADLQAIYTSAL